MAPAGSSHYHYCPEKEDRLEPENHGLILPPLNAGKKPKEVKRGYGKFNVFCLIVTVLVLIAATIVIALVLSQGRAEVDIIDRKSNPVDYVAKEHRQIQIPPQDFKRGLKNFYEKLMDEQKPEALRRKFESYLLELSAVKDEKDLKSFIVSLDSENSKMNKKWLEKVNAKLTEEDAFEAYRLTNEFCTWYEFLDEMRLNLTSYEIQKRYSHSDELLISDEPFINAVHEMKILDSRKSNELNELLKEWIHPFETIVTSSTVILKQKIILMSQVREALNNNESFYNKSNVYIFAWRILYLDDDLWMPETNVAVISPNWVFVKKNPTFFLGGHDAVEHINKTATFNNNGLPGRHGGNGGHFLGVGHFNKEQLVVYNDGGKGGDGQDGAEGRNGVDTPSDRSLFINDKKCKMMDKKYVNAFGEVVSTYIVLDNLGCGGNGTDGGAAGEGGSGGKSLFITQNGSEIIWGKNGGRGRGGNGGPGGKGAKRGCYYYAQGVRTDRLEQTTLLTCGNLDFPSGFSGKSDFIKSSEPKFKSKSEQEVFSDALKQYRSLAMREILKGDEVIGTFLEELDTFPMLSFSSFSQDIVDEFSLVEGSGKAEPYQSLIKRIKAFEQLAITHEETYLLKYFLTVAYGKLNSVNHGLDKCVIVDLDVYLKLMEEDILNSNSIPFSYKDHTMPYLLEMINGKISYLNDVLDFLIDKLYKIVSDYYTGAKEMNRLSGEMDRHETVYLTLVVAKFLKPLCAGMTNFVSKDKIPVAQRMEMEKVLREYELRHVATSFELSRDMGQGRHEKFDIARNPCIRYSASLNEPSKVSAPPSYITKYSTVSGDRFFRRKCITIQKLKALTLIGSNLESLKGGLNELKTSLKILHILVDLREGEVLNLHAAMDHLVATLDLLQSFRGKAQFMNCIDDVNAMAGDHLFSPNVSAARSDISNILIANQYKESVKAFSQWVFPHTHIYERLLPKYDNITAKEAIDGVRLLSKWVKEYKSTILYYDKFTKKATFNSNNSVGEFYKWHNSEVRGELHDLFEGKKIMLFADVENIHILTKSAIKFRTVKLEFQFKRRMTSDLENILNNVEVEMKHSGYSYYYYNERSYLHVSEELDLHYSFESDSYGEPVSYNMVYRKLMDGPAIFSPYTSWTVQLRPRDVVQNLLKFVDEVDIVLVGSGTYVEVIDYRPE